MGEDDSISTLSANPPENLKNTVVRKNIEGGLEGGDLLILQPLSNMSHLPHAPVLSPVPHVGSVVPPVIHFPKVLEYRRPSHLRRVRWLAFN